MTLEFLNDAANVVLAGPNGIGKPMIAQNIAHQALTRGHTARSGSQGWPKATGLARRAASCVLGMSSSLGVTVPCAT